MKASEFVKDKQVTYIEYVDDIIINIVIGNEVFGLNVDTSELTINESVIRSSDFTINGNILSNDTASLDLSDVDILS